MSSRVTYHFPIDHFGLVISPLLKDLLQQASGNRKRKVMFNRLVTLAKTTRQIDKGVEVAALGLTVDSAGQLTLAFTVELPDTSSGSEKTP